MTDSTDLPITERSRLRRLHQRGHFDRKTMYDIIDAMPLCHIGYNLDGKPMVTPTFQWREGDHIYWHGSSASRALRAANTTDVCLTVSILDAMVLARSGLHHSANSRSVMLFGTATKVEDPDAKTEKLKNFVDHLFPGRWETLRPMYTQELKATTILGMPIEEGSAKIRTGGPVDDEEDYSLPIWAGTIPIRTEVGTPEPDPRNLPDVSIPDHVTNFKIG